MRNITLFIFLIFTGAVAFGQNLIGFTEKEIINYMTGNHRQMNLSNIQNDKYYYLKYSNNSGTQTLLFFFNPDSVCQSIRFIYELSEKAEKVKEFNSLYKKIGENRWIDQQPDKECLIEINDEKWSCIVTIVPNK